MSHAYWTISDEENFLDFRIEKKSEGGKGGFEPATWVAAAIKVNETKTCSSNKSKVSCRSKYQSVSRPFIWYFFC